MSQKPQMSLKDFSEQLLVGYAIVSKGDFEASVTPEQAVDAYVNQQQSFPASWRDAVSEYFINEGYLKPDYEGSGYLITMTGLRRAEKLTRESAVNLWENVDTYHASNAPADPIENVTNPNNISTSGKIVFGQASALPKENVIVSLPHSDDDFRELVSTIKELITVLRGDNAFRHDRENERTFYELRAGAEVLEGATADAGLVERLVWVPLKEFGAEFRKESIRALAKKALSLVTTVFESLGQ